MDVGKLKIILVDINKLSDVIKNEVIETVYDELVKELMNPIQTTGSRTLVKEADYNRKISEVEKKKLDHDHSNKYFSSQEINKFTSDNFAVRLKQSNVATKADIDHFIEKADFHEKQKKINKKIALNKAKHVLIENELY